MHVTEDLLRKLALLEQSDRTIMSVYLDLRLGWDSAEEAIEKEIKRIKPALIPEELEYFETSLDFMYEYFDKKKSQGYQGPGLAFFIDLGEGYATGVETTISHDTSIAIDEEAIIHPLAKELDEYEPVGVIMADASGARVLISMGNVLEDEKDVNAKIHHLSKVGGWSQMRYQRRREKEIKHFAKDVADVASNLFQKEKVNRVLMAGRNRILTAIEEELPQRWRESIIDSIKWDMSLSDDEFARKIAPSLVKAEREQEEEILERFIAEYRRCGLAAAGMQNVLTALEIGQVDTLILDSDLDEETTEELTSKAEATSAHVEFIPARDSRLAKLGGIGALLRYKTDWQSRGDFCNK